MTNDKCNTEHGERLSFLISRFTGRINLALSDLELASEDLFQGHFPLEIFPSKLSKLSKLSK